MPEEITLNVEEESALDRAWDSLETDPAEHFAEALAEMFSEHDDAQRYALMADILGGLFGDESLTLFDEPEKFGEHDVSGEARDAAGKWTAGGDEEGEDDEPQLNDEQKKDLFTHGGCGILAQELLEELSGSEPVLWKNKDGTCYHAAVLHEGRLLHYGDLDEGYAPATKEELDEAVQYDFDPRIGEENARKLAKVAAKRIAGEVKGEQFWEETQHPRGKAGKFIEKHSAEARNAAKDAIKRILKGERTAETHKALVEHLSLLTVAQLHELKKEYGLSASAGLKEQLVSKLADRLGRGRTEGKKEEVKAPGAARQPWQMTKDEYHAIQSKGGYVPRIKTDRAHTKSLKKAINDGKEIPDVVLKDEPEHSNKTFDPWELNEHQYAMYSMFHSGFKGTGGKGGHKKDVQAALAAGKPVPPEVLADYPDLAPKPAPVPEKLPAKSDSPVASVPADLPDPESVPADKPVKAKDGSMWTKAKAGGEVSPVNGEFYKGGRWMPIHGLSPKMEKTEAKPPQGGDMGKPPSEDARNKGGQRGPRGPMSPEDIETEKRIREEKAKWREMNAGPLGRVKWLGDNPNSKAIGNSTVNLKEWKEFAEEMGPEKTKALADHLAKIVRSDMEAEGKKNREEIAKMSPEHRAAFSIKEEKEGEWEDYVMGKIKSDAEDVARMHGMGKHRKAVPESLYARALVDAMLGGYSTKRSTIDTMHNVNKILADAQAGKLA